MTSVKKETPSPAKIQRTVSSYLEGDFSDDDDMETGSPEGELISICRRKLPEEVQMSQ